MKFLDENMEHMRINNSFHLNIYSLTILLKEPNLTSVKSNYHLILVSRFVLWRKVVSVLIQASGEC